MLGAQGLSGTAVFGMFAAVLLVIALNVLFFGEEIRGCALDEISWENPDRSAVGAAPVDSR